MKTNDKTNDLPAPRTIRIGKANVGLFGLDQALNLLLTRKELGEEEAADLLFAEVKKQNYVPDSAAGLYREALRQEFRRRLGREISGEKHLTIRVLGSGCVSCNRLSALVIEVLQRHGQAADLESVHDLDEIWRFGVTRTPALLINGSLKCSGRMPTPAEVEAWLLEEFRHLDRFSGN
jgi:hypothetical protein